MNLTADRFLVQMSKLENSSELRPKPTAEEVAKMWENVDKTKLVQYKLKVVLSDDVVKLANGEKTGLEAIPESKMESQVT